MGRLKAVFFDVGGTLIDPQSDKASHLKVLEATRQRYGLDVSVDKLHRKFVDRIARQEQYQSQRWKPVLGLTEDVFREEMARYGIFASERDVQWFMKTYMHTYGKGIMLSKGAMDTLRGARQLGIHVGVLSDVDDAWLSMILDNLRLRLLLDSITTSQSVGVGKPNPKIFLTALKKGKCEPSEAIYAGDSLERDIRGAKAIGMKTAHISPNPSPEADFQLKSISEMLSVLKNLVETKQ